MRLPILFFSMWMFTAPAVAQPAPCEESVTGEAGEVIASVDARGKTTITWVAPRRPGIGQQTDHTSRPALMLDFGMGSDGVLKDVIAAIVSITSYSDPEIGKAPPLSSFRVRARVGGGVVEWAADKPATGEPVLVKRLKAAWPDELVIELVDRKGALVASAAFDLRVRNAVSALARQAKAKCGR